MPNKNTRTALSNVSQVKFAYYRQAMSNPKPGNMLYYSSERVVTVASALSKNRSKLLYHVAVCAPTRRYMNDKAFYQIGDEFSRDRGRKIAGGRLASHPYKIGLPKSMLQEGRRFSYHELELIILRHAVNNDSLPPCARKILATALKSREAENNANFTSAANPAEKGPESHSSDSPGAPGEIATDRSTSDNSAANSIDFWLNLSEA
jgi:hypothetical protein